MEFCFCQFLVTKVLFYHNAPFNSVIVIALPCFCDKLTLLFSALFIILREPKLNAPYGNVSMNGTIPFYEFIYCLKNGSRTL